MNCRFENMPGAMACGRCGTSLALATATIDVHPPRARPLQKRLRRIVPWQRGVARVLERAQDGAEAVGDFARFFRLPRLPVWLLCRAIVPGGGQTASGHRLRGRLFLGAYLALGVLGLLCFGSYLGSIFLGLAFSVHASSILDLLWQHSESFPARWLTTALIMPALAGLYVPPAWLLTRVAAPRTMSGTVQPFERGDCILINRWAYFASPPERGDVVMYHFPGLSGHGFRVDEGELVDRILACPFDRISADGGRILINREELPWRPLNPRAVPMFDEFTVPVDRYAIVASTLPSSARVTRQMRSSISLVPRSEILGRAYLRHYPLCRFWIIR